MSANPSRNPPRSLRARAVMWLSQREHSRVELRRKLLTQARREDTLASAANPELAASPEALTERVDTLLDWLEAHQYLSTERFVESRVHARAERWGNLRIRQELKQHQLVLPPEAARQLADTELERARQVRARKFGELPADRAGAARQARFLATRGFSPDVIRRVLRVDPTD